MEADKTASVNKKKKILSAIKLAFLVFILIGLPAIFYLKYGDALFTRESANLIINYLQENKHISILIIIALQVFQVVVCFLPGQPIQFASSYMFGVFGAVIISIIGAILGTAVSFVLARLLGHDALNVIFDEEKISSYRQKLNSAKAILIVFVIYLVPGIPKDLTSYAAGISDMRFTPFLVASTLGRLPAMFGSILFGHFFKTNNYTALIVLSAVVGVIVVLCIIFRKRIYEIIDKMEHNG